MNRTRQTRLIPIIIIAIGAILIGIALVFGFSSGGNVLTATATPLQETSDIPRISVEEAKRAYDSGEAKFVDVRDTDSYLAGHIAGAISIPLIELPERMDELSTGTMIITY